MNIEIVKLRTKNDMKNFLKLPWNIYKNNPYWVPPLFSEVRDTLSKKKKSFLGACSEGNIFSPKGWLQLNRMNLMRGPASPSLNDECAFLLEGFDKSPTVMMPYTHKYYLELAEKYGFHKAKDLYALLKKADDGIPERIEKIVEKIKKKIGIKIRPFDNFEYTIKTIKKDM